MKVAATRSGNLEEKIEEGKKDIGKKREEGKEGGREGGQPDPRLTGAQSARNRAASPPMCVPAKVFLLHFHHPAQDG